MTKEDLNNLLCDPDVIDKTADKIISDLGFRPEHQEITMSRKQVIERLKQHNEWRRGGSGEMMSPTMLGATIDNAIRLLET